MGRRWAIHLGQGAELVAEKFGISCTRQALEYHVKAGNLTECVRAKKPYKLDPDILVNEYEAKILPKKQLRTSVAASASGFASVTNVGAPKPGAQGRPVQAMALPPQPPAPLPTTPEHEIPALVAPAVGSKVRPNLLTSINAAKAWAELEKARKLQIERLASEREYMRVTDVKPTWEKAFLAISRGLMGVPSKVKSEHPDATFSMIESIRVECRDVLAKVFDDLMELHPEPDQPTAEEEMFDLPDEGDMEFET
jgi:hypothetical protein